MDVEKEFKDSSALYYLMQDVSNISDVEKLEIVIRDILQPVASHDSLETITDLLQRFVEKKAREDDSEPEPWSKEVYLKGYSTIEQL